MPASSGVDLVCTDFCTRKVGKLMAWKVPQPQTLGSPKKKKQYNSHLSNVPVFAPPIWKNKVLYLFQCQCLSADGVQGRHAQHVRLIQGSQSQPTIALQCADIYMLQYPEGLRNIKGHPLYTQIICCNDGVDRLNNACSLEAGLTQSL